MKTKSFKDLIVWQKAYRLVLEVYKITKTLPRSETYGLTQQIRRAAISIPSNIAEGFNRFHNKEYRQFLYIALGSCAELETQIEIATELNYINEENKKIILEKINHESRMITNLIKKLN